MASLTTKYFRLEGEIPVDTRNTFSFSERIGLFLVTEAAFLSFIFVGILLAMIFVGSYPFIHPLLHPNSVKPSYNGDGNKSDTLISYLCIWYLFSFLILFKPSVSLPRAHHCKTPLIIHFTRCDLEHKVDL
jgi:hypothetical protein